MTKRSRAAGIVAGIALIVGVVFSVQAQDVVPMAPLTRQDRILILAPHPDDESIGTAGIIQKALRVGAKVKVVCYTNGDANELSFILYEKRITFFKKAILYMGEVRRKETQNAMKFLGLNPDQTVFLGYPDHGTLFILRDYWGKVKPYRSLFTRVTKVSYPDALSYQAPYVGESILSDMKKVIQEFRPTKIFVSNPVDTNMDHRSLYIFLRTALWDLEGKIRPPRIYPYLIHAVHWPLPRGYKSRLTLDPPTKYVGMQWQEVRLTEEEVQKKHDAVAFYKSQLTYAPGYLYSFVRTNELFGDYPSLVLRRQEGPDLKWEDIGIDMIKAEKDDESEIIAEKDEDQKDESAGVERKNGNDVKVPRLSFARHNDNLWIKIIFNKKIDKTIGVSLYLFGYSKKAPFGEMPKIHISFGTFGVKVTDKRQRLNVKNIMMAHRNRSVILKIPLTILKDPDRIFSNVRVSGFPYEATAWRILELS